MSSIGLSVPPGLTITTETCQEYNLIGNKLPDGLWDEVIEGLRTVEEDMGATLGDPANPLLVSVRSGAAVSKPASLTIIAERERERGTYFCLDVRLQKCHLQLQSHMCCQSHTFITNYVSSP